MIWRASSVTHHQQHRTTRRGRRDFFAQEAHLSPWNGVNVARAEIAVLQHIATTGKSLIVGADIRGHFGCIEVAEELQMWPGQLYSTIRNLLAKEHLFDESYEINKRRLSMTDRGRQRLNRFNESRVRRLARSHS